jgi:hypothetical protein
MQRVRLPSKVVEGITQRNPITLISASAGDLRPQPFQSYKHCSTKYSRLSAMQQQSTGYTQSTRRQFPVDLPDQ